MPRLTSPALTFALAAALAGFALAAFSPAIFNDGDTYWHIRAGEWMLDHHAVLRRDVFSYTMTGEPWDAAEWLAELVMALAWRGDLMGVGGWTGLHLLFGAAAGLTCGVVAGALRARVETIAALLASVLGLCCVTGSLLARPHMLALPLLAAWTAGLVRAREAQRAPGWWLIAVMPLWANLHGSFAFGLTLAVALAVEAVFEAQDRRKAMLDWGGFVAAAIAACLLNPQGIAGLLFPLHLTAMTGLSHLGEWQPSDLSTLSPFAIALLALIAVLALGKIKVPPVRGLIILASIALALAHGRHQMLVGVCAPLLLMPSLARAWPAGSEKISLWLPRAAFGLLILALAVRVALPSWRSDDPVTPQNALAHVPRFARQMPVLNDYAFGGYLIWNGVRPFIDSRADLYGDLFLGNYAAITAPDRDALAASLATYHVRWTIFSARQPLVKTMDTMPGWHRLYADANAVVHVHD